MPDHDYNISFRRKCIYTVLEYSHATECKPLLLSVIWLMEHAIQHERRTEPQ